jgi:hypothetical protein
VAPDLRDHREYRVTQV